MSHNRGRYTREFKLDALKLVTDGRSVAEVARGEHARQSRPALPRLRQTATEPENRSQAATRL